MKKGAGKRILLADDDQALVRSMTDYLVFEGYEVVAAHNGKEALARMDERAPDLLVLDINMPGMGGLEVLERARADLPDAILMSEILPNMNGSAVAAIIKAMPSTRSIPIVLHDEFRTQNDELRAAWKVPEGAVKLVGPTDPWTLLNSVRTALNDFPRGRQGGV